MLSRASHGHNGFAFLWLLKSKIHKQKRSNKSFRSKDTTVAFDNLLTSLIHNLEVRYNEGVPVFGKFHFVDSSSTKELQIFIFCNIKFMIVQK